MPSHVSDSSRLLKNQSLHGNCQTVDLWASKVTLTESCLLSFHYKRPCSWLLSHHLSAAFWVAAMCQTQYARRHRLKERGREHVMSPRAWSQMQSLEQVHRRLFPQGSTFCTSLCILEGAVLKQPNHTLVHPMIIKSKFPCINSFSDAKSPFVGTG